MKDKEIILSVDKLNLALSGKPILRDITFEIRKKKITSIIGPSGAGKTQLIRCINRLAEMEEDCELSGKLMLYNQDLFSLNPITVRRKVGMVFQKPNPFPTMSIFQNVIAGYTLNSIKLSNNEKAEIVQDALTKTGLWDEVKDELDGASMALSGGQQQRLCIARSLALNPRMLLLDEPTSALDPKSAYLIEDLLLQLKKKVTILLVTHNIAQASRISNDVIFIKKGEIIEKNKASKIFTNPENSLTEDYLRRRYQ